MAARIPRRAGLVMAALLAFSAAGCDSFSLTDMFNLPGEELAPLALAVDRADAERNVGTIGLAPSGGLKPYAFELAADELYAGTNTQSIGSITGLSYSAGGAIGKMRITVVDALGASAIAYVAVLPQKPSITGVRIGGGETVNLAWTHAEIATIGKYRLEEAIDSLPYSSIAEPATTETTFTKNGLIKPKTYTYRLYAVSGVYESEPAVISLPPL